MPLSPKAIKAAMAPQTEFRLPNGDILKCAPTDGLTANYRITLEGASPLSHQTATVPYMIGVQLCQVLEDWSRLRYDDGSRGWNATRDYAPDERRPPQLPIVDDKALRQMLDAEPTWPDAEGITWSAYLERWADYFPKGQFARVLRDIATYLRRSAPDGLVPTQLPGQDLMTDALRRRAEAAEAEVASLREQLTAASMDRDEARNDAKQFRTAYDRVSKRLGRFRGRLRTACDTLRTIRDATELPFPAIEGEASFSGTGWFTAIATRELDFQAAETRREADIQSAENRPAATETDVRMAR